MAQNKSKLNITTDVRSLENRARIVKLEHLAIGGEGVRGERRSMVTKKMDKLQDDVDRLAKLFAMHGGRNG